LSSTSIENDAFTGKPIVTITRILEEDNVVVAEGTLVALPDSAPSEDGSASVTAGWNEAV
jgi:hypothetical protein